MQAGAGGGNLIRHALQPIAMLHLHSDGGQCDMQAVRAGQYFDLFVCALTTLCLFKQGMVLHCTGKEVACNIVRVILCSPYCALQFSPTVRYNLSLQ